MRMSLKSIGHIKGGFLVNFLVNFYEMPLIKHFYLDIIINLSFAEHMFKNTRQTSPYAVWRVSYAHKKVL